MGFANGHIGLLGLPDGYSTLGIGRTLSFDSPADSLSASSRRRSLQAQMHIEAQIIKIKTNSIVKSVWR